MSQQSKVSITPTQARPKINLSQYDAGRQVTFLLEENQQAYNIPTGSTVKIQGTKPSGFGFDIACYYSGNVVTLVTTADMTDEGGNFPAEIVITKDSTRLGTANIFVAVEASPHPTGTTDGQADIVIPELTALVERVEDAVESMHELTVNAVTLASTASATATYDGVTNTLTIGVPRGANFSYAENDGNITITRL